jgi:hypothetical protein
MVGRYASSFSPQALSTDSPSLVSNAGASGSVILTRRTFLTTTFSFRSSLPSRCRRRLRQPARPRPRRRRLRASCFLTPHCANTATSDHVPCLHLCFCRSILSTFRPSRTLVRIAFFARHRCVVRACSVSIVDYAYFHHSGKDRVDAMLDAVAVMYYRPKDVEAVGLGDRW